MDAAFESVTRALTVLFNPNSTNAERISANAKLNDLTKSEIHTNSELYLNVALVLIGSKDETMGPSVNDYLREIYVHYGFKVINELVKYNWYQFDQRRKDLLKKACIDWCNLRLFSLVGSAQIPCKIATSSLVLNACSQTITEIFIREWPNNWPNFLSEVTQSCSLVTLYSFLNISDYMHTRLIPSNPTRRKEIIKSLIQNREYVYEYFHHCLSIEESQGFHDLKLTIEYKQLLTLKSLETLETLFEWFPLNQESISRVFMLASKSPLNLDSQYQYKVKLHSYRCIQAIIKLSNPNRTEDMAIISDVFHNCSPDKFLHYLVSNILCTYLRFRTPIEDHSLLYELFILVLDIGVDAVCQVISQYNKDTTNTRLRATMIDNQNLWMAFLNFTIDCLRHNNTAFDEIILKFLLVYSKLHRESGDCGSRLRTPIDPSVDQSIPLQILTLIGHCKIEPKSVSLASTCELTACFNLDSYESYTILFNQNRNKFLLVVHEIARHHSHFCQVYIYNLFREMLGTVQVEMPNSHWATGVRSWNVVATMCAAIFPKLSPSPEFNVVMEAYFEQLLNAIKDSTKDETVLSSILSTLSAMAPFYSQFNSRLIQQLIEQIFGFTQKRANDPRRFGSELQHHASGLFIKLALNCSALLLPFFDIMREFIDGLAARNEISNIQFCTLYEGLLILSNHFEDSRVQGEFVQTHVLMRVDWIISYNFGPNGANFFRDIGLSEHPNLQLPELPYFAHKVFLNFFLALNLLSRLLKRLNPTRCLAIVGLSTFDYLMPFYKFMSAINSLWHLYQTKDSNLDQLCHPFYQQFLFTDTPTFQLNAICVDRPFLVPQDQMKSLLSSWDRSTPPSPILIGLHTQNRLNTLYSQTMHLLTISLNYLFYFHSACSTLEPVIESFLKNAFHLIFSNCKALPLVHYYELIKLYLSCLVSYCPRNDKFLKACEIVELLNDFLPFIFNKLDQKFQSIKHEKEIAIAHSEPTRGGNAFYGSSTGKNKEEHNFEICIDFAMTAIGQEFVTMLRAIFREPKNVSSWATKFQLESQQQMDKQVDDEMMEDDMGEASERTNKEPPKCNEDSLLFKYLIAYNPSPLVIIASNCLLWPMDNLRPAIVDVNRILLQNLIARNQIQSVDGFYYLAERIIRAINLTEKSDSGTVNSFVSLFSLLYEKVIYAYNLTGVVNLQLAQICGVEPGKWDQFAESLSRPATVNERKRQHKQLKGILENVYSKEMGSLHSMAKPSVACLGAIAATNQPSVADDPDTDTFSLAWLL